MGAHVENSVTSVSVMSALLFSSALAGREGLRQPLRQKNKTKSREFAEKDEEKNKDFLIVILKKQQLNISVIFRETQMKNSCIEFGAGAK